MSYLVLGIVLGLMALLLLMVWQGRARGCKHSWRPIGQRGQSIKFACAKCPAQKEMRL